MAQGPNGILVNGDHSENKMETFQLGPFTVPRLFCGLWQLSSSAWGTAPRSRMMKQFKKHCQAGLIAYDMADHYGDAEVLFGQFRSSYEEQDKVVCATKFCVFGACNVTEELVQANVTQRCKRIQSEKVDLLQFHWQDYADEQYMEALKILEKDERVTVLGLCNFDSERTEKIAESGIFVATNQVQFSLIDSRPMFKMGGVCEKYNIKLLTYGTLCGGFLAAKWLGQPEPDSYDEGMTPSQRKYFEMIVAWGGWDLFQDLLKVLSEIAAKHTVTVSNVATRWVLDFPYVGAVIVGSRMGVSEHIDDNLAVFGWSLDDSDRAAIKVVLDRSKRAQLFQDMGDCGAEYR